MAMQDIVKIHENDNVAVALRPLAMGGACLLYTSPSPRDA